MLTAGSSRSASARATAPSPRSKWTTPSATPRVMTLWYSQGSPPPRRCRTGFAAGGSAATKSCCWRLAPTCWSLICFGTPGRARPSGSSPRRTQGRKPSGRPGQGRTTGGRHLRSGIRGGDAQGKSQISAGSSTTIMTANASTHARCSSLAKAHGTPWPARSAGNWTSRHWPGCRGSARTPSARPTQAGCRPCRHRRRADVRGGARPWMKRPPRSSMSTRSSTTLIRSLRGTGISVKRDRQSPPKAGASRAICRRTRPGLVSSPSPATLSP